MKRSPLAAFAALVAALVATVALATPALAHDALKSSDPKKDSVVKSIDGVTLEFTSKVRLPYVIVRGKDGADRQLGDPVLDGAVVTQRLKDVLPDGKYTIAYRVVSSDGHPIEGEIPFTVKGAPVAAAPSPTATETPSSAAPAPVETSVTPVPVDAPQAAAQTGTGFPIWLIIVVGALVGIGFGFLLSVRKKKP